MWNIWKRTQRNVLPKLIFNHNTEANVQVLVEYAEVPTYHILKLYICTEGYSQYLVGTIDLQSYVQ